MLFKIKLLSEGDRVLNVWNDKVAILRVNGEVDIYQICNPEGGLPRLSEHVWRITHGNGGIEIVSSNGSVSGGSDEGDDFEISIRQPKLK